MYIIFIPTVPTSQNCFFYKKTISTRIFIPFLRDGRGKKGLKIICNYFTPDVSIYSYDVLEAEKCAGTIVSTEKNVKF